MINKLKLNTKVYNELRRTYLDEDDLREGQEFCDKCKGKGITEYKVPDFLQSVCPKCQGIGIIDWVEKVVGKAPIPSGMHGTSGSSFMVPIPAGFYGTSGAAKVTNI